MLKRSSKSKSGQYPLAFKLKAIKRVERGEGVLPVARELGVTRKALHDWIRACKAHGPEGLNRKRGPLPRGGPLSLPVDETERSTPCPAGAGRRRGGAASQRRAAPHVQRDRCTGGLASGRTDDGSAPTGGRPRRLEIQGYRILRKSSSPRPQYQRLQAGRFP